MTLNDLTDLHIGLDLDHTLFDPAPRTCREIKHRYGLSYTPADLTEYNFELPGTGGVMYESVIMDLYEEPDVIRNMPPVPGAAEAVQALSEAGATISIITHRPPETFEWSKDALDAHDIPYDNFVEDVPDEKVNADADIDILIDDSPEQVAGMAAHQHHGILLLRPHNQHSIPADQNVHVPVRGEQHPTDVVRSGATQWGTITELIGTRALHSPAEVHAPTPIA